MPAGGVAAPAVLPQQQPAPEEMVRATINGVSVMVPKNAVVACAEPQGLPQEPELRPDTKRCSSLLTKVISSVVSAHWTECQECGNGDGDPPTWGALINSFEVGSQIVDEVFSRMAACNEVHTLCVHGPGLHGVLECTLCSPLALTLTATSVWHCRRVACAH